MYGDSDVMLRRAGQLREQGADIRLLADQLISQTESLGWTGRAAESMRHRIRDRATHLRAAAAQHETAADSLDRHAHEVERIQETIAETERKATSLIVEARTRIARIEAANESQADSGVHTLPDADDRTLVDFTPPPSGHQDWLAVDLPGLRTS
jgi:chromosome segregation ATPase